MQPNFLWRYRPNCQGRKGASKLKRQVMPMRCYEHREKEAVGVCQSCGRGVCEECQQVRFGQVLCPSCAERARAGGGWFTFRFRLPPIEQLWEEVEELVRGAVGATCPECGRTVQPEFVACPYCGAALKKRCPSCERRLRPGWRYCPHCGASI